MEPLLVEVVRGDVVEARHAVHALVVRDGRVELALGDPGLVTYLRSSAKPMQALPAVRARPSLDDEQIALLCASHRATPAQLAVVRRLLADAPATEDELECGDGPERIEHNCSGKHAGFLALCRARGWDSPGYRLLDHPCQAAVLAEVAELAEVDPVAIPVGVDGCGVPTFALTLERCGHAFGRIRLREGGRRVVDAMRAHPELLVGPVVVDVRLIEALDGWVAKGGAEGLLCAAADDGTALVLKSVDGSFRPLAPAAEHVLSLLGLDVDTLGDDFVRSARGDRVGVVRVAL